MPEKNWARNLTYQAKHWHRPDSVAMLQALVAQSERLKVVGTRHAFNNSADTTGDAVSLEQLPTRFALDRDAQTVTVSGGVRYGELAATLHAEGFALHNLASLPHISVAGACATATHGSGDGNGNLATAVVGLELVQADGALVTLRRATDPEIFDGVVVGLGALGIVTALTLSVEPTYTVAQTVYENLPVTDLFAHFDAITSSAYSVSLFTDWQTETIPQVWCKQRATSDTAPPRLFGATRATQPRHPLPGLAATPCTDQGGVPGPWHERLPHFRLAFTPSNGEELQSEFFVPRHHALDAFAALTELNTQIGPLLQISEIRTVAADTLWLSPSFAQETVGFHFTWLPDEPAVRALLPTIEAALAPFGVRPHWGKLFTPDGAALESAYPRLPDFRALRDRFDPNRKFGNAYLAELL